MLQITPEATGVVRAMREERGIPDEYGLRVYSDTTDDGQQAIRLGFADEPFEGDQITEAPADENTKVFVSPDLADALDDIVIDVDEAGTETRLVLRPT
jgi:Fe-S cluster assembly iron-binding protein IscA